MSREAACSCGQLRLICEGEPVRVSLCHCHACQRRTGSTFGVQMRFPCEKVRIEGRSSTWARVGDSGGTVTFHFCPTCGGTVYWELKQLPDFIAPAYGAFAGDTVAAPAISVYEDRAHEWVRPALTDMEHHN